MFRHQDFYSAVGVYFCHLVSRTLYAPLRIRYIGLQNETVTAQMLSWYITRKVEQRFSLNELFKPISKELVLLIRRYKCYLGLNCSL